MSSSHNKKTVSPIVVARSRTFYMVLAAGAATLLQQRCLIRFVVGQLQVTIYILEVTLIYEAQLYGTRCFIDVLVSADAPPPST